VAGRLSELRAINVIAEVLDARGATSVARLALARGISQRRLEDVFKVTTGVTIRSFAASLRLHEAAAFLLEDQPVKNAQLALQWRSASSFSRQFSRHFGVAPAQYRAEGQQVADACSDGGMCAWFRVTAGIRIHSGVGGL